MATISFVMQKKGGVGKSVCASLYYQALAEAGRSVVGVDTDPSNKSLAAYKSLNIIALDILGKEDDVDKSLFDQLWGAIDSVPRDSHVIVDSGSSSFPALRAYLMANKAIEPLEGSGHTVRIHVVIAGGADLGHTCSSLKDLAVNFPDTQFVPWLNPYNGDIHTDDGKEFEDLLVFKEHAHQFHAIVKIPDRCQHSMWRKDLQQHFIKCQSFQEAIKSPANHIMTRQRLKIFWDDTKMAIAAANIL